MNNLPLRTEELPTVLLDVVFRLKVSDVMTRDVATAPVRSSLREIQSIMKARAVSGLPLLDGKRVVGIVSVQDLLEAHDAGSVNATADSFMTKEVVFLEDDMPLSFAISYFDKFPYRRYPVLDRDRNLVGVITSRDIVSSLLLEINKEVERLEAELGLTEHEGDGAVSREFTIRRHDFANAGKASTEIKKILKDRGVPPKTIRRVAVAAYELEMNIVVHSAGGRLLFKLEDRKATVIARDRGPGIPDVEAALGVGFSTANEWIRSLGFGAGMGLPNVQRVSDEFDIQAQGATLVTATILCQEGC